MSAKASRAATITGSAVTSGREWSSAELSALVDNAREPVVSILMSTHLPGPESKEDHIRLKNLVNQIAVPDKATEAMVGAVREVIADPGFWSHPTEGLALFADARGVRQYRLPAPVPEIGISGRRPYVTPLLSILEGEGRFYLLELHQHGIRLHEGSRFALREIVISGFSGTAEEHQHAHADRSESKQVVHPVRQVDHVHLGSAHEEGAKERALKYFRSVDHAIRPIIQESDAPLLVSGVEWLQPLYAEVNRYPRFITSGIHADTAALGTRALHDRAWNLIAQRFQQAQSGALERHAQLRQRGQAIDDLPGAIAAILARRVASLLIGRDHARWGTIDEATGAVVEHATRLPGDEDLLNAAAVLALRAGAQAWVVDGKHIPGGSGISACLRY
jgi:hypothetical protein